MTINGTNGATNGAAHPVNVDALPSRADEVAELLDAVQNLLIPFIRAADEDAAIKPTGRGLTIDGSEPRTVLVESHPPKKLESLLNLQLPENGVGKEGLLDVVQRILQYSVNTWDQGFMDKLYASTNAVHVYQVSPALALIEKHTTTQLAHLFGFNGPYAGGISQPGGSASNATSVVVARNTLYPETKRSGIHGSDRRFVLFTSAHGHYSLEKAAQMFGFGSDAVRAVPVDGDGRMDVAELEKMVAAAKAGGETPFYVNATAGTTVMGSFDPIDGIADVCARHGLWLHVDGSWGGPVAFNADVRRERLRGVERADSVAFTPHKMLGVPVTCSFLLAKDLRHVRKAMTLPAGYLFHNEDELEDTNVLYDLADFTPQCGRKGEALKLFLAWLSAGSAGFSDRIRTAFERGELLYSLLAKSSNISLVSKSPLPCLQVCFYYAPGGQLAADPATNSKRTEEIARRLIKRGWMVDFAPGEKGKFFRVVVNGETRVGTVEGLVKAVEEVGAEVVGEE
ncbi:Glutamate decarboxylase [Lasiodiplodia theobromae]|uniref:Glutamate decarboxylase n=1 Tax=Lasiodiplodia theobromae TaxID=45133 RepID=UPI0015C33ED6|nr:Glutamate decarboxylase [Lasiodiplodia theobromae]KAF4537614.1 Glutamate decarboxylase [Lasiodiplodia theobromae]